MLVAGAAALLVSLGDVVTNHFQLALGGQVVQADPIRIMEAVITGVSFLGAGTIIRSRSGGQVEGLTTAATLLYELPWEHVSPLYGKVHKGEGALLYQKRSLPVIEPALA